jgi:organic hydroperoxide reductase OsmC/OhrA
MSEKQKQHGYSTTVQWTGNTGSGTASYRAYSRDHEIVVAGKLPILGSSDPNFRGDRTRYNPEELLLASLSACHMLWYLHLCSEAGIVVSAYRDEAAGTMIETEDGGGRFTGVTLRPKVKIGPGSNEKLALELHDKAHHLCFIANSVNFPVHCEPSLEIE